MAQIVWLIQTLGRVIGDEVESIVLGNELGVFTRKLLRLLPESRNSLVILVQRDGEAVCLVVDGHEHERVIVNVTKEANARLHAPVVVQVERRVVAPEEATLETAHVAV